MCTKVPVSELIKLPISWVHGDDERLNSVFKTLKMGQGINALIKLRLWQNVYVGRWWS